MPARIVRVIHAFRAFYSPGHPFVLILALALLFAACGQNATSSTAPGTTPTPIPTIARDTYGTPITFPKTPPQRIISLVPSTSEILAALHLESRVVGIDYNTDYPSTLTSLPRISDANGAYNIERIVALKPDLVLSQGGQTKQYDGQLKQLGINVVDLQLSSIPQVIEQIRLVGHLTFAQQTADTLAQQMQQQIEQIKEKVAGTTAPTVMLEIDYSSPGKPYVFGGTSFGDELAQDANARNIFHNNSSNGGFPQVTDEAVISANPEYIVLTEELAYGGDAKLVYKRVNWTGIAAVKAHRVYHLNTELLQVPGPHLVQGLRCLAQLFHSDKFSEPIPDYCSVTA